ncbi:ABC transporter ATP-binding protein [Ornithinimicrobium sp. Y1847]|uniref:ABC transporter ATP-binding protein n=1 Tax=Ornithinimicrobium sp. Y1847 TaxID=3405419 RepID=UPI003B677433
MATSPEAVTESEFRADVRMLRQLFTLVPWRMRWRIILLVLASGVTAALDIIGIVTMLPLMQILTTDGGLPSAVERWVVPVIGTNDRSTILLAMALIVGSAFVVKNGVTVLLRYRCISITQEAASAAQSSLLSRYLSATYSSHRRRSKSTVLQAVTGGVPTGFGLLLGYISILIDGITVIFLFATLVILSPIASATAVVVFGGAAIMMSRVFKPWALRYAIRSLELNTQAWGYINPAVEGFRESRIFGKERVFTGAYTQNRREIARLNSRTALLAETPKYVLEIVLILGVLLVALLLFSTRDEATAFGLLAVFAAASIRIIPCFNRLVATANSVRGARPSLRLVSEQLEELERDVDVRNSDPEGQMRGTLDSDLQISDVGYRYPDSQINVLTGVTATIKRGSTVALVGASGAGKTTFADILAGLLYATEGSISVGGRNIADDPHGWRSRVAMVSQKVYVWEATLRDLITFADPVDEVDERHLDDVLRRSRLHDVVASLPEGLDTVIGESGSRLSGGQVQRVGIARALYADPQLLILDEATSALDNETEHEITRTIRDLHGKITVVVIAHRLSTVKDADEILFFSQGRLQSRGTMQELAASDPEFARLVELGSLN